METSKHKSTTLNLWCKILIYAGAFYIFDNLFYKFILS
jgi:hypothetical protein